MTKRLPSELVERIREICEEIRTQREELGDRTDEVQESIEELVAQAFALGREQGRNER